MQRGRGKQVNHHSANMWWYGIKKKACNADCGYHICDFVAPWQFPPDGTSQPYTIDCLNSWAQPVAAHPPCRRPY